MSNSYFSIINEQNKLSLNKPAGTDRVYYSELNEWYTTNAFRSFSLKYVVDKCIYYKSGNKEHAVRSGSFLLACKQPDVKAYFDSCSPVKSICIDIRPETMEEAFTVMSSANENNFDNFLDGYFKQPAFFEAVCPATDAVPFTSKLNELVSAIRYGIADDLVNKEWFLDLAEKIIYHEYGNYKVMQGLPALKTETKKELYRRLKIGKEYIDEQYLQIKEVNEVAQSCMLSEFHFFRSFRQAFNITPYQYMLKKRLELAATLIQFSEIPITDIAFQCSFPDIFTFSKAFKKHFNVSPVAFAGGRGAGKRKLRSRQA